MKDELNKSFKSFGRLVLSLFTFGTRANNEESDVNLGDVNPKMKMSLWKKMLLLLLGKWL